MNTFLFTSAPLFSHLDWGGYLKTAQILAQRGHRVIWVAEEGPIAERVSQTGLEVEVVEAIGFDWDLPEEPHDYDPEAWAAYKLRRNFDTWLPVEKVAAGTQSLIDIAQASQAQAIVSDPLLASAALASEALQLPFAIVGVPAESPVEKTWLPAEGEMMKEGLARLDALCTQFEITGKHMIQLSAGLWPHSPDMHISFFSEDWYHRRDDVALPQNRFAGGTKSAPKTSPPAWLNDLPQDTPLIFMTLGSTFNYEPDFFYTAAKAIFSIGAYAVIATQDAELAQGLANIIPAEMALVRESVEADHLFPRLRGVVQHGGPGTTHAAILHGVPQIIVAPGPGQGTQAHLVSRAGIGKFLHLEEITLENLRGLITSVVTDPQIQTKANQLQASFAALPGIDGAADWLTTLC